MRRRLVSLTIISAAVLLTAACGSSGSSSSAGSASGTGSTSSTQPTGTPLTIGVMAPIQSTSESDPFVEAAAKIAALEVNAAGGVDGRPVEIDFCDDHFTANGAAVCAQKLLVQDKVWLMAGDEGTEEAAIAPALKSENTISWGSFGASVASTTNSRVFILVPLQLGSFATTTMLPSSIKKIDLVSDISPYAAAAEAGFKAVIKPGVTFKVVSVPLTETSMDTACEQVKRDGAQAVWLGTISSQVAPVAQACAALGLTNETYIIGSTGTTEQIMQTFTNLHLKNVVDMAFSQQAIDEFQADIAKYGSQVGGITQSYLDKAVNTWLAVKLLPTLVKDAGSTDPDKIRAYLDKQTAFSTNGATPPINFTATPLAAEPRLKNDKAYEGEISNDKLVQQGQQIFTDPAVTG
jgi:ABC-type branched-subunit amino acid transport system substrate-binding protein